MQCCALYNMRFIVEGGHVKCWLRKDHRYYCCRKHADFAVEKAGSAQRGARGNRRARRGGRFTRPTTVT